MNDLEKRLLQKHKLTQVKGLSTIFSEAADEVTRLQAENEHFKASLKIQKDLHESAKNYATQVTAENEALRARVAQLETAALSAVQLMPGGQAKAALRDAYDAEESAEAWLLRKQAEAVVPAIMVTAQEFGRPDIVYSAMRMFAEDYAQRLHTQADALERQSVEEKDI